MNKTGLQQWVDMYHKADKERFEALLQRDKYKKVLDEIEEILLKTPTDSQVKCIAAKCNILNRINAVKENE